MPNERVEMNVRNFELLPVSEILKISEERLNYIKDCASFVINYNNNELNNNRMFSRYKSGYSMMLGYDLATRLLSKTNGNKMFYPQGHREFYFETGSEKSLFAMLVVDFDCNYFKIYQSKLDEGKNSSEVMDILSTYYGIKSAKLIQIERYYLALLSKIAKSKNIGIFEEVEEEKSPVK